MHASRDRPAIPARCVAAALVAAAPCAAQDLVPAGVINDALRGEPAVVIAPSDPAARRYATAIRDRFVPGGEILADADVEVADLRGKRLMVYATPEHAWMRAHAARLPFRFDGDSVTIDGRRFEGDRLRVVVAMRNPDDPARTAVVYAAQRSADLVDVNSLFHGPTEWLVADGGNTLAAGAFLTVSLAPDRMRADLDSLVARIEAVHPSARDGLPAPVAAAAQRARERVGAPLSRIEFARVAGGVLLALGDAHSALALPGSGERFDVSFTWTRDGPIVDADSEPLRRGDRIVAFGRHAAADLERLAASVVPAENPHWVRHVAPRLLTDPAALRMLGVADAATLRVRIERDGAELEVDVGRARSTVSRGATVPWARFRIDADASLGVLTLDRCVVDATYEKVLGDFFRAVNDGGIARVAVDLRENSGGSSQVVDLFLRHLDVGEFASFSGDVRWSAEALAQRNGVGEPRFDAAKPNRVRNDRVVDPPPFAGELFVLTGPATFSSGNWFATVVQDNGIGTVVGEPTGNAPSSWGDVLAFTLAESGLSYRLSFKRWYRPDRSRDPATCLEPDVWAPRTRDSIREGRDPVIEWLRERR